ncbi:hypothetical protein H5410_059468 [Solanum commersonii]|uniref:Uncharacterized protein n=1 Tax=Solanum commersonii TaxID=4109 RepID=A0A9J5W3J2_SOLCO|nr:hypothetical protein H5410_059468 [Solanum commersonii]
MVLTFVLQMIYSCSVEQILSLLGIGSSASGLHVNVDKSAIYMAGISDATRQVIVEAFGFTVGSLPFRYYQFTSIEKITCSWSFGTLFAGLSFGQGVCLCHGKKVCRPKAAGGLNILLLELWNKTAILKHR